MHASLVVFASSRFACRSPLASPSAAIAALLTEVRLIRPSILQAATASVYVKIGGSRCAGDTQARSQYTSTLERTRCCTDYLSGTPGGHAAAAHASPRRGPRAPSELLARLRSPLSPSPSPPSALRHTVPFHAFSHLTRCFLPLHTSLLFSSLSASRSFLAALPSTSAYRSYPSSLRRCCLSTYHLPSSPFSRSRVVTHLCLARAVYSLHHRRHHPLPRSLLATHHFASCLSALSRYSLHTSFSLHLLSLFIFSSSSFLLFFFSFSSIFSLSSFLFSLSFSLLFSFFFFLFSFFSFFFFSFLSSFFFSLLFSSSSLFSFFSLFSFSFSFSLSSSLFSFFHLFLLSFLLFFLFYYLLSFFIFSLIFFYFFFFSLFLSLSFFFSLLFSSYSLLLLFSSHFFSFFFFFLFFFFSSFLFSFYFLFSLLFSLSFSFSFFLFFLFSLSSSSSSFFLSLFSFFFFFLISFFFFLFYFFFFFFFIFFFFLFFLIIFFFFSLFFEVNLAGRSSRPSPLRRWASCWWACSRARCSTPPKALCVCLSAAEPFRRGQPESLLLVLVRLRPRQRAGSAHLLHFDSRVTELQSDAVERMSTVPGRDDLVLRRDREIKGSSVGRRLSDEAGAGWLHRP